MTSEVAEIFYVGNFVTTYIYIYNHIFSSSSSSPLSSTMVFCHLSSNPNPSQMYDHRWYGDDDDLNMMYVL